MFLELLAIILLQGSYVRAVDLNSILGRNRCFKDHQEHCSSDFIDVYKNLSKPVTILTDADTWMLLYTRKNPEEPEKLHKCAGKLPPNTNFKSSKRVLVLFMPFFSQYCNTAVYREWTKQLLQREEINIIVIDYGWRNRLDYATAIMNAREIVKYQILILLRSIQEQTGIEKKQIIFIGHSLGAHVAAMVGSEFKVSRIIGIDPSGPGFDENKTPLEDRLDPSDADLVEVWHCNAGDFLPNFGSKYDSGHINFWINGGSIQTACHKYSFISLLKMDYIYGLATLFSPTACYHAHCAQYFKASINPRKCQFIGVKCDNYVDFKTGKCGSCGSNGENCLIMGWDTDKYITKSPNTPQRYYVDTSLDWPYCNNSYVKLDGYLETYRSSLQYSRNISIM